MRIVVGDVLRDAAQANPEGVAVADGDDRLSYRELDDMSNRLARLLQRQGVRIGDRVGLYLEKSASAVVGVYGALKAGGAYVPMDAHAPIARVAHIARDCGLRCVLTSRSKQGCWHDLVTMAPCIEHLVVLDAEGSELQDSGPASTVGRDAFTVEQPSPLGLHLVDQDLAYILYTSGSTGGPKGVTLTHRNATAFVSWAAETFAIRPADRLSSHAPFHFDLSVFDLFAAAWGAATVVLVPHQASVFPTEVARFIEDEGITVWYSVPSILSMLVMHGGLAERRLSELRTILFAGEVFPTKYLRALMGLLPHVRFANLYGPTETNVCTWYEVPGLPEDMIETIPIGRPIENDTVHVVTDKGTLAGDGEVGELYVRGATVMRGYWGDTERTAQRLVPDPFGGAFPDVVFRTGDLVRWTADGNLRYLGRRDAQIKSRGYRIELGEIEEALDAHPAVRECAVVAVPDDLISNRIRAFVVTTADAAELLRFCRQQLPSYMVPHELKIVENLPRTSTGKTDRQALLSQDPPLRPAPASGAEG